MSGRRYSRRRARIALYRLFTTVLLASLLCSAIPPAGGSATAAVSSPARRSFESSRAEEGPVAVRVDATTVGNTAFSRVRANPDGSRTLTVSPRPLHRWDTASSTWKEWVNEWRPVAGDGPFAFESTANGYEARIGTPESIASGGPALRYAVDGAAISMHLLGAAPRSATAHGARVSLADALPGVGIDYLVDNERIKEEIRLRSAPASAAAAVLTFNLQLTEVTARKQADGSVDFENASGEALIRMPRHFMADSSGDPERGYSDAISVSLTELGNGRVQLKLTPDFGWLTDPDRGYPVVIDPTVYSARYWPTGAAAQNATIYEADPNRNDPGTALGNNLLYVGKRPDGLRRDVLIRFPELTQLPQDSTVIGATLDLYAEGGSDAMPMEMYANTAPWDDETVTWGTRPSMGGTIHASRSSIAPGVNSFNVSNLVRSWIQGTLHNNGVRILSTGAAGQTVNFHSSYASNQPELEVTYVTATRFGVNRLWTYASQDYGGGNTGSVNVSTGNFVLQHDGGSIAARGFDVGLTHTYNSQDPYYQSPSSFSYPGADAWYGEGWSVSERMQLYELNGGNAIVLKDGSGGSNRVYAKAGASSGIQNYHRPLYYDATLTKDVSGTATYARTYTLAPNSGGRTLYFDADGKLTELTDRNGNYLRYGYDASGRLTAITDVAGRRTALEYAGTGGRLSKITDTAGRVSTYGYDGYGNLTTISHGVGTVDEVTTTLTYRAAVNQIMSVTNPRGHRSYIGYRTDHDWETAGSESGWAVKTGPATLTQSADRAYTGSGSLKVSLSGISNSTYAEVSRAYATPEAFNSVPQEFAILIYVPAGAPRLKATVVARYRDVNAGWASDATLATGQWNAVRVEDMRVNPAFPIHEMGVQLRTASGEPAYTGAVYLDHQFFKGVTTSLTDAEPNDNTIAGFDYDWDGAATTSAGKPTTTVSRLDEDGSTFRDSRYTYGRDGEVTRVRDPLGNPTGVRYDSLLRLIEVTPPGETAGTDGTTKLRYGYYPNSNEAQTFTNEAEDASRRGANLENGDTRYVIDARNEGRRQHTGGDGQPDQRFLATVYVRNAAGNVLQTQANEYNAGTDLEVGDHDTFPTAYKRWRTTAYGYGSGGVLTAMTPPECYKKPSAEEYDCRTEYVYQSTNTGYLTQISAPAGTGEVNADGTPKRRVTTVVPNADGAPASVTDPRGQKTTFDYDGLGRLEKVSYGMQDGSADFFHTYVYDPNGNLTEARETAGSLVLGKTTWTYDENNQPLTEARTQGTTRTVTYDYYPNGQTRTMASYAGTVTFTYDGALRLGTQTDPKDGGRAISYAYDSRSRLIKTRFPSGVEQTTTYDIRGREKEIRLGTATTQHQRFTYDYGDPNAGTFWAGLVVRSTEDTGGVGSSATSYTYDLLNRLTRVERTGASAYQESYAWDDNDNRLSVTKDGVTTAATYDRANQLTQLGSTGYTYDRNGNARTYGNVSLTYDAANKWTGGSVGTTSLAFAYDAFGRRVSRTVGGAETEYWYDATGLAQETGTDGLSFLRSPGGALLARDHTATGITVNYGTDRQGSVTALTDTDTSLDNTYSYDVWGGIVRATGARINPLRYVGGYYDSATELYQMNARYYQAGAGRFTQQDPKAGSVFEPSRYIYTFGDPANYTDKSGLEIDKRYGASPGATSGYVAGSGVFARPSGFRQSTVNQAVAEAPTNSSGQMVCPTCGTTIPATTTVQTRNGPVTRRGFDLDHYPTTWSQRVQEMQGWDPPPTRSRVLDYYNAGVRVQCPACNQGHLYEGYP